MRRGAYLILACLALLLSQITGAGAHDHGAGGAIHPDGSVHSGGLRGGGRMEDRGGLRGGAQTHHGHMGHEHRHGHFLGRHRGEAVIILGPGYPPYDPGYSETMPPSEYLQQEPEPDNSYYCQYPADTDEYQRLCANEPHEIPPLPY